MPKFPNWRVGSPAFTDQSKQFLLMQLLAVCTVRVDPQRCLWATCEGHALWLCLGC